MTTRIAFVPYGPSDSVILLRNSVNEALEQTGLDALARKVMPRNSMWNSRPSDIMVNYGNRHYGSDFYRGATVLNNINAVNLAANKTRAFLAMTNEDVKTVEWTTDIDTAQSWIDGGEIVYSRSVLSGHSGEGIEVHVPSGTRIELPVVPLYTKGIQGQRREWRVHVFKGVITYVQKKIRRNGYREDPNYREDVRNHHTGWVYSNQFTDTPTDAVLSNAVKAVQALGLDFGAVDVISRGNLAWILEVNTAPGLSGTTLQTYTHNIVEFVKSRTSNTEPQYIVAYNVPVEFTDEVEPVHTVEEAPISTSESNTISTPPTQMEESGVDVTYPNAPVTERGMYLVDVRSPGSSQVCAQNVIVYFCGRNFYRHGWNLPLHIREIHNVRPITEVVTTSGSYTIN